MGTISASEARATLPDLLVRVDGGEEITITRHGKPVAVLIRPDRLAPRRGESVIEAAERLGQMLDDARRRPLPVAEISDERLEELIQYVRESRDSR